MNKFDNKVHSEGTTLDCLNVDYDGYLKIKEYMRSKDMSVLVNNVGGNF